MKEYINELENVEFLPEDDGLEETSEEEVVKEESKDE